MRFCQLHWSRLRRAVQDQGLWDLVSKDGQTAEARADEGEFDPLIGAHDLVIQTALDAGGLAVLGSNNDGSERCPVCYGMAFDPEFDQTLENAVGAVRRYALEEGLVVNQ